MFAIGPAVTLGLGSLPPERLKYGSGLFNMMRNLGGAVGFAICGAILNDQTNAHFLHIASNLTPANGALRTFMATTASRLAPLVGSAQGGSAAALKELWSLAYREAATMAYADAFRVLMVACLVAAALVPLMRKVVPAPVASTRGH